VQHDGRRKARVEEKKQHEKGCDELIPVEGGAGVGRGERLYQFTKT